jgi:LuxR family maltose regulon positive regulatory protein
MNSDQWSRLERCLSLLPRDLVEQDPAALVLEGWLHVARQNFSGVAVCVERIDTLNGALSPETRDNIKHVPGQFETLKSLVHYMAADGQSALALSRKALKIIPIHHKRARLFADLYQLGAYQMVGDLEIGLSIYQKAMDRYINRDKSYHAMYLGSLGLVYWMDADLLALRQAAGSILALTQEYPLPAAVSFGLYYFGIVNYHHNELQNAEENLIQVTGSYKSASPMNYAHGAFALALTYQAQGKPDLAREVSETVVHDSIETNNTDMLRVARGFEAELALRQGRLTESSRWLEKYQAKPIMPAFCFYVPQLTAVKIWLAHNTSDSRRRAADLLEQLHVFFESTHNRRFQIDVLALQALLHGNRRQETAAAEKLSRALTLAEPGGFIRLFLDLGPQMADLLKRLIRKNIAVEYAGQILSAFRQDAHPAIQRFSSSSNSAFRIPNSDFHTSQPLTEPLSKRELEILVLLAQRLSTKEIADRLFIAPNTAKKHVGNIYRKLNVSSRGQAAEKARVLGILAQR